MPQSLVKNCVHIVFSTKYRQNLIVPPYEEELHAYMGGICNALECLVIAIGGWVNHVHLLIRVSPKIAMMTLVQKVKANSSKWMKTKDENLHNFFWQNGYAAFSVHPDEVEVVVRYIKNQHAHHEGKTFKQEMLNYMKQYAIEHDEQYMWD